MIKDLLLPREKYAEECKKYGRSPFTFEVEKDGQVLYYFGANHSLDPYNHQYPLLKQYWSNFLEVTQGKEKIVLVEIEPRNPTHQDEQSVIKAGSEGDFITFLANKANVPVACPDISKLEFIKMRPDFNKNAFLLHTFLSWIDQHQKLDGFKDKFENNFEEWCERQKKREVWKELKISLEKVKQIYKEVIGRDFNLEENQNNFINPNRTDTKLNELVREYSNERELKIVSEIEGYWKEGKSILAVLGSGHLIIQRPALEKLLV